jgi:putative transposase
VRRSAPPYNIDENNSTFCVLYRLSLSLRGLLTSWPHAPPHRLVDQGIYMVTGSTYLKAHFFQTPDKLQYLNNSLLSLSKEYSWELHAWAVFSNHYHFIAKSPSDPTNLSEWIGILHQSTASEVNRRDQILQRKIWYQFWESKITIHTSYLARLNYVHQNPVKHGIVSVASQYPWCSAHQFETQANRSFVKSVYSFDYTQTTSRIGNLTRRRLKTLVTAF